MTLLLKVSLLKFSQTFFLMVLLINKLNFISVLHCTNVKAI